MAPQRMNIKRECTHGGIHQHGTMRAYNADRCRCAPCADATAEYERRRRKQIAYGRHQPFVDAEPTRQHVRALMASGMGVDRITEVAGISHGVLRRLLYGNNGRPPSSLIRPQAAATLQAITVPDLAENRYIDGTGTRRRLQALAVNGWSLRQLTIQMGYKDGSNRAYQLIHCRLVTVRNARKVAEVYDRLWNQPAPSAHFGAVTRAKAEARKAGYAPPLSWDEDAIDDPKAKPNLRGDNEGGIDEVIVERIMAGTLRLPRNTRPPEREEAVRRLAAYGYTDFQIGQRVGMSTNNVQWYRNRHGIPSGASKGTAA